MKLGGNPIPVIGHAFVGLATAMVTRPPEPARQDRSFRAVIHGFWGLFAVLLAYAPDICRQVLFFAGWDDAHLFCHSILFAAAFPISIALALRIAGIPCGRIFLVALLSIVVHDILDVAQATDRVPFWPFSGHPVSLGAFSIPSGMFMEILLFGGGFLVFILLRRLTGPTAIPVRGRVENPSTRVQRFAAFNRILLAAVILLAVATHSLRDLRERQLESARALIEGGRYTQGLKLLEASERWPSNAKPGRADYLRGVASLQAGEREKAETFLLKSFGVDPTYLWVVADLATFYADSPQPLSLRKHLASPYMDSLRRDFGDSKEAFAALKRIEAKFSSDGHSGGPGPATHRNLAASR